MKAIAVVLLALLLSATAYGQSLTFTPLVSTKGLMVYVTPDSNIIADTGKALGNITIGDAVWGVGIPDGTVIEDTIDSDSVIVLSNTISVGGWKVLNFGYYVHTTYGSGDWMGWPVEVFPTDVTGDATLVTASISDSADGIGNTDIVFFEAFEDSAKADSVAAAWPKATTYRLLGAVSLTTKTDLGTSNVLTANNIQMVLPKHNLYFRLLAKAAYGPTLIMTPLRVHLNFKEN